MNAFMLKQWLQGSDPYALGIGSVAHHRLKIVDAEEGAVLSHLVLEDVFEGFPSFLLHAED